jgi:hypothetical protein
MVDRSLGGKVLSVLSSLRLAVVTMVTLASVCGFATFYEALHGTPAVQREIYQTPWFAALLGLLGVNVFSVMVSRYPWTKHHVGFLIAHVGILTLLVGSLVSIYRGLDSNMAVYEGETSDRVELHDRTLQVALPGQSVRGSFPVLFEKRPPHPGREQRFRVPGSDVVLVAEEYQPHVAVSEAFAPAASGPPALHFLLQAPMATEDGWLVPDDPDHGRIDLGMVSFAFHAATDEADARRLLAQPEGANHLSFVVVPGGRLLYAASDPSGALQTGEVVPGQPVRTGWPALGVTVDRFLPAAESERTVSPQKPPAKEEKRRPAVRVHLEGPQGRSESEWLLWGEQRRVRFGDGLASLGYRSSEAILPFRVTLLKFSDESYPGSRMAATYESTVRVDDPETGSFETLISMNHPLHHRGYIFFQSSFVEGRPMMSIFSVARAPGLPLVYLGTAMIGTGIVWMFYLKPYLAKRQAAAALAAHRARENRNEAKPADAVPAGPGAEPAARGA